MVKWWVKCAVGREFDLISHLPASHVSCFGRVESLLATEVEMSQWASQVCFFFFFSSSFFLIGFALLCSLKERHGIHYIHTYTHAHTYIHTYIYTHIHAHIHTYIHTSNRVCLLTSLVFKMVYWLLVQPDGLSVLIHRCRCVRVCVVCVYTVCVSVCEWDVWETEWETVWETECVREWERVCERESVWETREQYTHGMRTCVLYSHIFLLMVISHLTLLIFVI